MSFIQVDDKKCKKDGICVTECPAGIIKLRDKTKPPEMVEGGDQICLVCGHCVAVCPHGALSHRKTPLEVCPPIEDELVISPDQALQFLRSRRSVRHYKQKPVAKETLQSLIDAARYAPTGGNAQDLAWTVHTDADTIKDIADLTVEWMRAFVESGADGGASYLPFIIAAYDAGVDTVTRKAPCLITASAPKRNSNGLVDLTIALSYLELMAVPVGLGTCWAGLIARALRFSEPLQERVGLPDGHAHFYPMMIGFPKFGYHRLPERKPARVFWK